MLRGAAASLRRVIQGKRALLFPLLHPEVATIQNQLITVLQLLLKSHQSRHGGSSNVGARKGSTVATFVQVCLN